MNATLDALTANGHLDLTHEQESCFTEKDAKALADELDIGWWSKNRERVLRSISEA